MCIPPDKDSEDSRAVALVQQLGYCQFLLSSPFNYTQELRSLSPSLDLREEGGSPIGKDLLECKDVGSESLQFGASPE